MLSIKKPSSLIFLAIKMTQRRRVVKNIVRGHDEHLLQKSFTICLDEAERRKVLHEIEGVGVCVCLEIRSGRLE